MVAVFLAEHAAAVLLHIKAQRTGLLLSLPEAGAEVPVQEPDTVLPAHALRCLRQQLMVLVGAHQQGGGEAVIAVPGGILGRLGQPQGIAHAAAVVDIPADRPAELPQAVILLHNKLHADGRGVGHQRVPPGLVLLIGVDVRVIPVGHRLDALAPQLLDAGDGAGSAAGVHQCFFHRRSLMTAKREGFSDLLPGLAPCFLLPERSWAVR